MSIVMSSIFLSTIVVNTARRGEYRVPVPNILKIVSTMTGLIMCFSLFSDKT